jgi:hypothetical protein
MIVAETNNIFFLFFLLLIPKMMIHRNGLHAEKTCRLAREIKKEDPDYRVENSIKPADHLSFLTFTASSIAMLKNYAACSHGSFISQHGALRLARSAIHHQNTTKKSPPNPI